MIDLALDALATYRLTRLAVEDAIFDGPRLRLHDRLIEDGRPSLAYLLGCPWCASVWIGAGVVIARHVAPRAWSACARALAFSAIAGILSER